MCSYMRVFTVLENISLYCLISLAYFRLLLTNLRNVIFIHTSPRVLSVPRRDQFSESSSRKIACVADELNCETTVFIILQILFATRAVLKIVEYLTIIIQISYTV